MQADLERITQLAESVTAQHGLAVVDVKLAQQGKRRILEVTIFRHSGRISLDDCEAVSRQLDELIEQETQPLFNGEFLLEVQSPGIDRKIASEREFSVFAGMPVEVKTKAKVEGLGAVFTGKLLGLEGSQVRVADPVKFSDAPKSKKKAAVVEQEPVANPVSVDLSNIISVRLSPQMTPDAVLTAEGESDGIE